MNKETEKKLVHYTAAVENYLENYFSQLKGVPKSLIDSMIYSINAGGKRLRPALLSGTYEVFSNDALEDILPFAASIEMIHTYSLIHDDLPAMDDDDLRRGKPSNHVIFGEAGAILAGDALLNTAVENMLSNISGNNIDRKLRSAKTMMKASGAAGMIGGQILDIKGAADSSELKNMHELKTGALFDAAILSGGILGGCNKEDERLLLDFSHSLGCAFQIKDDILDVESTDDVLGKPTGSDSRNDKVTYSSLYGIDKAKKMLFEKIDKALAALAKLDRDTAFLEDIAVFIRDRKD